MAELDPTTRRVMEERLMPAAKNLLGNRGSSEVQQLLKAGENATAEQKKKIAEKYLAPFFGEGSEYGDILLDEILKIASDQAKLDAVEKALSNSPVNASIDFSPSKFLERAARQMTGNYEGTENPNSGKDIGKILAPMTEPRKEIKGEQETDGSARTQSRVEIEDHEAGVPVPPPPMPAGITVKITEEEEEGGEDYIGGQMEGSKAQEQPYSEVPGADAKTAREAKKEGLGKDKKREKDASYKDEMAENIQQQQHMAAAEVARGEAEAAAAEQQAEEEKRKKEGTTLVGKLKHPAVLAGLTVGGAAVGIGSLLGLDYGVNTLFS